MSDTEQGSKRGRKPRHRDIPAVRALTSALLPEVRHFSTKDLEIRSSEDPNQIVITGCPIVYNAPYEVRDHLGHYTETMLPGVAKDVVGGDVCFYLNHNLDDKPYARTTNGTLAFEDGEDGLHFTAVLDRRSHSHNDLAISIERGDISQMSVGFSVARPGGDSWNDERTERSIARFGSLFDVSAVTYPASPATSIEIAKRMVLRAPVESSARIYKLASEIRAGKVLSDSNQQLLVDAVAAMHSVLSTSGYELNQLLLPDDDEDDITGEEPDEPQNEPENETENQVDQLDDTDDGASRRNLALAEAELVLLRSRRRP